MSNVQMHMKDNIDIFMCPACKGDMEVVNDEVRCLKSDHHYKIEEGIPLLFCLTNLENMKNDVTEVVKNFYEKSPFPHYECFENVGDLIQKAQNSFFANLLNNQISFNARVLEVGCGTGQMSNFLGVANRHLFGTDMCLNSLKLGHEFKRKNDLKSVGFYQMNLFRPIFKEESFHIVICNGVLHHTSDPLGGFESISKLVKKGGYILIGLYNTYGRLITDIRRLIFKLSNDNFKFLDPRLRGQDRGQTKKESWFNDQYKHPHESKHTIGEVIKWFDNNGIDFVYGIPNTKAFNSFNLQDSIFKKHPRGNWMDHLITQSGLFLRGSKEGGFFIMIGKKK